VGTPNSIVKLVIFSHKPCWRCDAAPTGFATDGGFPFQVAAFAELFNETILLVPCHPQIDRQGQIPLDGSGLRVVPLPPPFASGLGRKMLFILWFFRCAPAILREFRNADAVHAPIPGDVGTVGMLLAWLFRKPLFVRHCGNWLRPTTLAEKFWRWFMEAVAGGRNVMLATGGAAEPPSRKNPNVHWIFSTSLTQQELQIYAGERAYPADGQLRLIIVARQEKAKGTGTVIQCLRLLVKRFPQVSLDIVGEGSAIPEFKLLASETGVAERVHSSGKLNHEQVMQRLRDAHLFVFPTTSSDGFPKAVLEALASGLPVVATKVSVLPQLLGNGCGVLIDKATPEDVARGIEQALSNPAQYEAMSRKAIETARQYSLEAWRDTIGGYLSAAWGPLRKKEDKRLKMELGHRR
jgi:glycosyltransferase involved in cell wall biosynthesis